MWDGYVCVECKLQYRLRLFILQTFGKKLWVGRWQRSITVPHTALQLHGSTNFDQGQFRDRD